MSDLRTAAQQALEALETLAPTKGPSIYNSARDALRAALAQQDEPVEEHKYWCASLTQLLLSDPPKRAPCDCKKKQAEPVEPVAWMFPGSDSIITAETKAYRGVLAENWTPPLYTSPFQRLPLTEEEIDKIFKHLCNTVGASCKTMARAVERAHGIKE